MLIYIHHITKYFKVARALFYKFYQNLTFYYQIYQIKSIALVIVW